jgi:hypothetical protein
MGWIQYIDRQPKADDVWITCPRCGGGGMDWDRDNQPTDRAHLHGENPSMAWAGYRPTNTCGRCHGEGGTWLPKSKEKSRLNVGYDEGGQWRRAHLQHWYDHKGGWHPALEADERAAYRWTFDSDTDPDQWEDAK